MWGKKSTFFLLPYSISTVEYQFMGYSIEPTKHFIIHLNLLRMKIHSKIIIALLSPFFVLGFSACTNDGKKEMSDSASELGKDIKNEADRIGDSTAAALDKAG
jgi:hypothetical protein